MAVSPGPTLVLCLLSFGLLNSSPLDSCPDFCTCEHFSHLNCSSAGLSLAPQNIRSAVSELDLSNNQLGALTFKSKFYRLHKVWLGNNSITHLSLCVDSDVINRRVSQQRSGPGPWRRGRCLLWAPTLQLLSVERNQLQKLPQGLGQQRELRTLNLSFNKISKLERGDFAHLRQLEELHLQHNHITILHPLMFEKLDKLKVLDLSFNLLTTLHPLTYVSLRDFGADVVLNGNSWICDCSMLFLQKEMTAHSNRALKTWSIDCSSPLAHAGMNLMELDEDELKCPDSDSSGKLHKDITVHRGARILLTCSEADAVWCTPRGLITRNRHMDGLLITDITEQDEGLYLCMSQSHQTLSIFNVQINEKIRKSRSVSQDKPYRLEKMILRNNTSTNVTQSRFALAVSLSVIITFIVAFILGVLLQPYICACWQKAKARKQKPQTASVPNEQQEQYINEAYLHCEDVDDFEPHRERRVTFTEYTEEGNMQYYDTVAGDEEGNGAVIEPGQSSSESSDESGSEDGKRNGKNVNNLRKKVEFEHIPDSAERNSLSSQSSHSSAEGKILQRGSSTPNTSQITEEQVQKTEIATIEVTQIAIESSNDIPGFSSEPFADWSPHQHGSSIMDPDLDNGDQFEFSDSVRSGSPISPSSLNGSFRAPNLLVPNVNRKIHFESSSSSSDISDGEPTHYTVNADSEEEAEVLEKNKATNKISQTVKSSSSSSDSETEGHHVVETWPAVDLEHVPSIKRRMIITTFSKEAAVQNEFQKEEQPLSNINQEPPTVKKRRAPVPPPRKLSSSSSDSEDERIYENIKQQGRPKLPIYSKQESSIISTDIKPQSDTSSSSESEEDQEHYYENFQQVTSPNKLPIVMLEQEPQWPVINLAKVPKVKRSLDFKRVKPMVDTSSSSDSEDEHLSVTVTHVQGKVPVGVTNLSKPSSGTSSSSESEDEQEHIYENIQQVTSPNKLPVVLLEQEPPWPVINLVKVPKVKRSLDFKRIAPTVDTSSSSDSEDEQLSVTHVRGKPPVGVTNLSKLSSGTSSSSESDGEQEIKVVMNREQTSPIKPPTAAIPNQWPVINLVKVPKVKRRLDIKTTLPASRSASSGSEDEILQVNVTQVQGKLPLTPISVEKRDSWTSSSSESEDEFEIVKENLQQIAPLTKPTAESPWPVINLGRIPKVKRRLDIKEKINTKVTEVPERVQSTSIKVPNPDSGTSSSSESEDELKIKEEKQHKEKIQIVTIPKRQPLESQWPMINLAKVPKVKQRLDIKTISPGIDSSSSSESEDEKVNVNVTSVQVPGKLPSTAVTVQKQDSGTSSSSSDSEEEQETKIVMDNLQKTSPTAKQPAVESQWPVIDLVRIPKVKRRLDIKEKVKMPLVPESLPSTTIKIPKLESGTSSSSESEDEQKIKEKLYQEKVQIVTTPNRLPSEAQWPIINLANVPKVKQRLDIKQRVNRKVPLVPERVPSTSLKIPKRDSGTSSSSDSEDEREHKIRENLQQATSPIRPPTALEPNQWPVIDLVKVPKVKRRLDIKNTVPVSESSSSDSEDDRVKVNITQVQGKLPPAPIYVQKPNSGTSSSSESEDEQKITNKQTRVESQWPVIDFVRIPKVKRRLDIKERVNAKVAPERVPSSIKVPNSDSGTSSSSESEDDQQIKIKVNEENFQQTISPIKRPAALKPHQDSQWPVINLVKMPKVKRRLDIKTTVVASESSSSNSEDETVQVNVTQMQGKRPSTLISVQKPESGTSSSSDSEEETPRGTDNSKLKTQWPILDLKHSGKLKKRLDFKVKLATPKLPSGSDSDSEKPKIKQTLVQERLPSIKSPKPESGTSSSSESEDDRGTREVTKDNVLLVTSQTKQPTGVSQWPEIDPIRIPKLKRRLDVKEKIQEPEIGLSTTIKVPKSDSSSSESEEEQQIKIVQTKTKQPAVESPWPAINLVRIPKVKRRLDVRERVKATVVQERVPSINIKVPKPESGTSSSSESEVEERVPSKNIKSELGSRVESQTEWPVVNTEGITRIKRRLDFKIPLQSTPLPIPSSGGTQQTLRKEHSSSSSSSDEEDIKSSQISVGQTTRLSSQTSTGLDVKGTFRKPGLHESSSSSDAENDKAKFSSGSVKSQDKHFIKVSPLRPTLSPTKTSHNIELEKYKVVTDDFRGKSSSNDPSPAVTPELQSKWATMNLGLSRFRKRLDITRTSNPSSPPLTSPKKDILITGLEMPYTKNVMITEQVAPAPRREQNVDSSSSSSESEDDSKLEGKSKVEVDFVSRQVSLSNIPKVKRSLNVTAVPKKSSSSSSSDEEAVNMMVPDVSTGIPQVKRRLNIKAPTPPPSSSSSDDEKVYAHKFSDVTDQRSIEYKRTIMKSSSFDSNASNTQWKTHRELSYVESSAQSPKKLSLDNIKRKLLPSKQNELPPNLRWTSVGSHLSEHPVPITKRHQDGYTSPLAMSSPPPMPKQDSSDSSSSDDEQRQTLIVTQRTYNPRSVTFNTSPTIMNVANFEERSELRGLSALKAKSSERKIWEYETETFTESAPVSVDYTPEVYKWTVDSKTKISHPQSYSVSTSSPATEDRRLADMLYGIPTYKRHIIKSTEQPEDLPPPIPSSPLPEESPDYTWRSPQSSLSRGNLGFYTVQQQRTVEESVDEPFHDNANISAV